MGNTVHRLVSSFVRVVIVATPTFLLSRVPAFHLRWIWYLSVASVTLQMFLSLLLIRSSSAAGSGSPRPGAGAGAAS
jgi:hypothetical protein